MSSEKETKSLYEIITEIAEIEEGLAYGEIAWSYVPDKLDMALGMGHPADILDDVFCDVGNQLLSNPDAKVTKTELKNLLKNLKAYSEGFSVSELNEPIKDLRAYIAAM